jgi:hypothetical protein
LSIACRKSFGTPDDMPPPEVGSSNWSNITAQRYSRHFGE